MPLGKVWGLLERKTWPTTEQGMISSWPPHCQTCGDETRGSSTPRGHRCPRIKGIPQSRVLKEVPGPHPEGHFHVLAPPDLHLIVVGADVLEIGPGDGEEAAGKGRRSERERENGGWREAACTPLRLHPQNGLKKIKKK